MEAQSTANRAPGCSLPACCGFQRTYSPLRNSSSKVVPSSSSPLILPRNSFRVSIRCSYRVPEQISAIAQLPRSAPQAPRAFMETGAVATAANQMGSEIQLNLAQFTRLTPEQLFVPPSPGSASRRTASGRARDRPRPAPPGSRGGTAPTTTDAHLAGQCLFPRFHGRRPPLPRGGHPSARSWRRQGELGPASPRTTAAGGSRRVGIPSTGSAAPRPRAPVISVRDRGALRRALPDPRRPRATRAGGRRKRAIPAQGFPALSRRCPQSMARANMVRRIDGQRWPRQAGAGRSGGTSARCRHA